VASARKRHTLRVSKRTVALKKSVYCWAELNFFYRLMLHLCRYPLPVDFTVAKKEE